MGNSSPCESAPFATRSLWTQRSSPIRPASSIVTETNPLRSVRSPSTCTVSRASSSAGRAGSITWIPNAGTRTASTSPSSVANVPLCAVEAGLNTTSFSACADEYVSAAPTATTSASQAIPPCTARNASRRTSPNCSRASSYTSLMELPGRMS